MLITILATVLVLGVLILVHELGHFWMAKVADIEVPRFSIGLGPKMVGFRRGETEYVISWIPLGGYVRMAGMADLEDLEGGPEERKPVPAADLGLLAEEPRPPGPRDFEAKSPGMRALVISAGVIMNMIFAFLVYSAGALLWGIEQVPEATIARVVQAELPAGTQALAEVEAGARIAAVAGDEVADWQDFQFKVAAARPGPLQIDFENRPPITIDLPRDEEERAGLWRALRPEFDLEPVVGSLVAGMPAREAGFEPGDRVLAVEGRPVESWQDLVGAVQGAADRALQLQVQRGERRLLLEVTPVARTPEGAAAGAEPVGQIGVFPQVQSERPGVLGAAAYGAGQTWYYTAFTVDFLAKLLTGRADPRNVGGPILIGQLSGEVARAGVQALMGFMALLSINLAVFNLLPIPVLDGGQLVFIAIEAVRGQALSLDQRMRLSQIGIVLLVALMVWVIANDVLRLFGI